MKEVIDEAKQVGKIYHFTSYKYMDQIVSSKFRLVTGWMKYGTHDKKEFISFTRNKNMPGSTLTTVPNEVRITIDGNSMSDKYKFEPFADSKGGYGRNGEVGFDESEERLVVDTKKYPNGVDISRYIISTDVMSPVVNNDDYDEETPKPKSLMAFKELINGLKKSNIKFNVVESFK